MPTVETVDALRKEPALQRDFLVELLSSLVRIRSVNPGDSEAGMAARVSELLEPTGAEVATVEFAPGRPSVGAVLRGDGDGPLLVLNAHQDTVPIDDESLWRSDPFTLEARDGYLYGRGACDLKAGLTIQIAVAHYLAAHAGGLNGSLVLHFAAGEECGEPGTRSLLDAGFTGNFGITLEPTALKVATAQRGLVFYRVRIKGRSIHASRAHLGVNPNAFVGAVLEEVATYDQDIRERKHPLLPSGSCTPTMIRAGVKENAVPDSCDITLDRRLLPGETVDGELAALQARLDGLRGRLPGLDFELACLPYPFEPAEIDPGSRFAARLVEAVEVVTGDAGEIVGTPYSSDVRNLVNDAGIEAVTFGAGDIADCHCANERVSVSQLCDAALVTAKVAADLLLV